MSRKVSSSYNLPVFIVQWINQKAQKTGMTYSAIVERALYLAIEADRKSPEIIENRSFDPIVED